MATYRVKSPYVLLKTRDSQSGKAVVAGFYQGAIVSDEQIEKESLKRHLAKKMIERVKAAPKPPPPPDPGNEDPQDPPDGAVVDLESMTVAQLEAYAEERGIDLGGASRKADIAAAIGSAPPLPAAGADGEQVE